MNSWNTRAFVRASLYPFLIHILWEWNSGDGRAWHMHACSAVQRAVCMHASARAAQWSYAYVYRMHAHCSARYAIPRACTQLYARWDKGQCSARAGSADELRRPTVRMHAFSLWNINDCGQSDYFCGQSDYFCGQIDYFQAIVVSMPPISTNHSSGFLKWGI